MAGYDPKDSTSVKAPVPDYEAAMTGDIKGMKIGIPREYRVEGMSAEIDALWQQGVKWLEAVGAEAVEVSLPQDRKSTRPVTNAHIVCRLVREKKKEKTNKYSSTRVRTKITTVHQAQNV